MTSLYSSLDDLAFPTLFVLRPKSICLAYLGKTRSRTESSAADSFYIDTIDCMMVKSAANCPSLFVSCRIVLNLLYQSEKETPSPKRNGINTCSVPTHILVSSAVLSSDTSKQ